MSRYIDADALFKTFEETEWYNNADRDEIAERLLLEQPTVDAVPVSRCKNCRHMICTASIEHNEGEVTKYYMCNYWHRPTDEDGYCHVAERKDCDAKRKS